MMNIKLKKTIWDTEETWETYKYEILLDGKKVGEAYTIINAEDDGPTYLEDFTINREERNKGVGTQVLKMLAEEAWDGIYMAPTDKNNQRLYERLGEEMEDAPEVDQGFGVYIIY